MKNLRITDKLHAKKDREIVHASHAPGIDEITLCGYTQEWESSPTDDAVTCKECLAVIAHVKKHERMWL